MGVDAAFPTWHPHVDTWLLVIALAAAYAVTVARVGPHHVAPGRPPVTKLQAVCFSLGVAAVWVASDWPVHDIAEELNYSMHMVQHLVLSMVAAPLLLLGTPAWMLRAILRPPSRLFGTVRFLSRFFHSCSRVNWSSGNPAGSPRMSRTSSLMMPSSNFKPARFAGSSIASRSSKALSGVMRT